MGVEGWRCGSRVLREEENDAEAERKGIAERGTMDSDWIVQGRAKREESERKVLKAECRSREAVVQRC
jgi:hypothetical protein